MTATPKRARPTNRNNRPPFPLGHRHWEAKPGGVLEPIDDPFAGIADSGERASGEGDTPNNYRMATLETLGYDVYSPEMFGILDAEDDSWVEDEQAPGVQVDVYATLDDDERYDKVRTNYAFVLRFLFCSRIFWIYAPDLFTCVGALNILIPIARASLHRQQAEEEREAREQAEIAMIENEHRAQLLSTLVERITGRIDAFDPNDRSDAALERALAAVGDNRMAHIRLLAHFGRDERADAELDAFASDADIAGPFMQGLVELARGYVARERKQWSDAFRHFKTAIEKIESEEPESDDKTEAELHAAQAYIHAGEMALAGRDWAAAKPLLEHATFLAHDLLADVEADEDDLDDASGFGAQEILAYGEHLLGDGSLMEYTAAGMRHCLDAAEHHYKQAHAAAQQLHPDHPLVEANADALNRIYQIREDGDEPPRYHRPSTA